MSLETFAEELSIRLVKSGHEVAVQCDAGSYTANDYKGVKLFFTGFTKDSHPVKYYLTGMRWALRDYDIILVATTFGSYFYFLKWFRKKIIITNTDGLESRREKWALPQKIYIKLSELLAVLQSDYLIADSAGIFKYLKKNYPFAERKIRTIEYGAEIVDSYIPSVLGKYGLEPDSYYLVVCRLEPENNIAMIIDGYRNAVTEKSLVIVGNITNTRYLRNIISDLNDPQIRFLGGIYDKKVLNSLRFACKAYIHGHSVGGTNPSLLEAMGCGNIAICHDNAFNREVTCGAQLYFSNISELSDNINKVENLPADESDRYKKSGIDRIHDYYNWDLIFQKYSALLGIVSVK